MYTGIKVKLVRTAPMPYQHYQYRLPLGIASLSSFLESKGFNIKQQDLFADENSSRGKFNSIMSKLMRISVSIEFKKYDGNLDKLSTNLLKNPLLNLYTRKLAGRIVYKNFDVIGLSVSTFKDILPAILLARYLKQEGKIVILGGSFIKISKDYFAENFSSFDYMVYTNGELSLLKILEYLDGKIKNKKDIPSVIYREKDRLIKNPPRTVKLEEIPPPDFDDLIKAGNYKFGGGLVIPYTIALGCREKCPFCSFKNHDFYFDSKSVTKIMNDLKFLKEKYASNNFSFISSSNPYSNNRLFRKLINSFIKEKLTISWESYMRLDNLDEVLAKKMKESGCLILVVGVESGSDKILKYIKKSSITKIKKGLRISQKTGLELAVQLLVGFPYETEEDIKQTIRLIKGYTPTIKVVLINIFGLPENSDMSLNPDKYGITNIRRPVYYPFSTGLYFDETRRTSPLRRTNLIDKHLNLLIKELKRENIKILFGNKTNESNDYCLSNYTFI